MTTQTIIEGRDLTVGQVFTGMVVASVAMWVPIVYGLDALAHWVMR